METLFLWGTAYCMVAILTAVIMPLHRPITVQYHPRRAVAWCLFWPVYWLAVIWYEVIGGLLMRYIKSTPDIVPPCKCGAQHFSKMMQCSRGDCPLRELKRQ